MFQISWGEGLRRCAACGGVQQGISCACCPILSYGAQAPRLGVRLPPVCLPRPASRLLNC